MAERYVCDPVSEIRSTLRSLDGVPRQGSEGAPDAWLEIEPSYAAALDGLARDLEPVTPGLEDRGSVTRSDQGRGILQLGFFEGDHEDRWTGDSLAADG